MSNQSTAVTIDALTEIWQRVLQRVSIGTDDNFFDLGGNDILADDLFAEIAKVGGPVLPSATLCRAPTIRALGALLARPTLPQFSPFVLLRAGSVYPPIIIAHGMGGRASFSQLAKHIGTSNPVYGIQARGVDGLEAPLDRIEDMATLYLDALKQLQPEGPYILIGYSFGGLVALEMAQCLVEDGKNIALLMLIDTYPHPRYLPSRERLRLFVKRMGGHFSRIKRLPVRSSFSHLLRALQLRFHAAESNDPRAVIPETLRLSLVRTTARVKESDFVALRHYRPRFYRGKITFVRPETNSYLPTDPAAIWKKLAADFEVETVPGDHLGMVGTHFERLAEVLTRHAEKAVAAAPAADLNRLAGKMSH